MSEDLTKSPDTGHADGTTTPGSVTPKSKLDTLPREDLVKYIKRQLVITQKAKAKCDELTKENAALKNQPQMNGDDGERIKSLESELSELKTEKDEMLAAYNSVQEQQESSASKIRELTEQVECMQMKDETLTSSFQFMQQEYDVFKKKNKELEEQVSVLTEARDSMIGQVKQLKQSRSEGEGQLRHQLDHALSKKEQLDETVENLELKCSQWEQQHKQLLSQHEEMTGKLAALTDDLEHVLTEKGQLEEELLAAKNQSQVVSHMEAELAESKGQSEVIARLQGQVDELQGQLTDSKSEKEEVNQLLQLTETKHSNLEQSLSKIEAELASSRNDVEELKALADERLEKANELEKACQDLNKTAKEWEGKHVILQQELDEYASAREMLNSKLDATEKSLRELTVEKESLKSAQGESKDTTDHDRIHELESLLEQRANDFSLEKAKLLEEESANRDTIKELQDKLNEWESMIQLIQNGKTQAEGDLTEMMEREKSTMNDLDDLNSSLHEALQERDSLRDQICKMTEEKGGVAGRLNHLKEMLDKLTFERDELNENFKALKHQFSAKEEELEELSKDNELLNEENETQQKGVQDLKGRGTELQDVVNKLEIEKAEILKQLTETQGEGSSSIEELAQCKSCNESLKQDNEKLMIEVEEKKRELEISAGEVEKFKKNMDESKRQLESFLPERDMLEEKLVQFSNIRRQFDAVSDENSKLKEEVDALKSSTAVHIEQQEEATNIANENLKSLEEKIATTEEAKQKLEGEIAQLSSALKDSEELVQKENAQFMEASNCLEKSRADLDTLTTKFKGSEQQKDEILKAKNDIESQLLATTASLEDTNKIVNSLQSESGEAITELQQTLQQLRPEYEALKQEKEELTTKIGTLQEELKTKDESLASVQEQLNETKQKFNQVQSEEKDALQSNTDLEARVEELNTERQELNRARDQLDTDLSELKQNWLESEEMRKAKCQELEELQGTHESALNERTSFMQEKDKLDTDVSELKQALSEAEKSRKKNSDELTELQSQLETVKTERTEFMRKKDKFETDVSELKQALAEAEENRKQKTDTLSEVQLKLETVTAEKLAIMRSKDKLEIDVSELKQALSEAEETRKSESAQLDDLQASHTTSQTTNSQLQTENNNLKKTLDTIKQGSDSSTKEIAATREELIALKEEKNSLVQQLTMVESEHTELAETYNSLIGEGSLMLKKLAELKEEYDTMETAHDALDKACRELQKEKQDSQATKSKLEDNLKQLADTNTKLQTSLQDSKARAGTLETDLAQLRCAFEDKNSAAESNTGALSSSLKVKDEQLQDLQKVMDEVVGENQALVLKVKDLESRVSESVQKSQESGANNEKLADLQKQLKEKEDRENKFKQLALKAKKDAADLKPKLDAALKLCESLKIDKQNLESELARSQQQVQLKGQSTSQHFQNFQSLQAEYDKLENKVEEEKDSRKGVEKAMKQVAEELANLKTENVELKEDKDRINAQVDKLQKDLKDFEAVKLSMEHEREAERIQKEMAIQEKAEIEGKLHQMNLEHDAQTDGHEVVLAALRNEVKELQDKLTHTRKEVQSSNMMDLEIADYERTVKTLHEAVAESEAKVTEADTEVKRLEEVTASLQKQLETSESQYLQAEDRGNKLKQMLVKTKKDLADAKKLEGEQRTSDAQLRGQLEQVTQECEEQKIQIAGLVGENQTLTERSRSITDNHQRSTRSLEARVQSLEHDLQLAQLEQKTILAEYEGYKVRVHSVLKQQKTKTQEELSLEQEKQEKERLQKSLDQLRLKYQESHAQQTATQSEKENLQDELDRLQTRYSRVLADLQEKEQLWKERLDSLCAERSASSSEHVETIKQLTLQNDSLTHTFKDQIRVLQEEHHRNIETYQRQMDMAERENGNLQTRIQNILRDMSPERDGVAVDTHQGSLDVRQEERQSGEGMEHIDPEPNVCLRSVSTSSSLAMMPFEQLLTTQSMDDSSSQKTIDQDDSPLQASLATAEKRIEHLTELLNESEATVMRLTEQAKILKEEIRRMERNQVRDKSISNMEYLKNIVYKFLTLKTGDERTQLIPVLTTMLKFSPEEKDRITAIAEGEEPAPVGAAPPTPGADKKSGWGNYLHRWSGMS